MILMFFLSWETYLLVSFILSVIAIIFYILLMKHLSRLD